MVALVDDMGSRVAVNPDHVVSVHDASPPGDGYGVARVILADGRTFRVLMTLDAVLLVLNGGEA